MLFVSTTVSAQSTIKVMPTTNGTVTVDKTSASWGDEVTITVTPDEGYYFEKKNNNSLYFFPYIFFKHQKNRLGRQMGIDAGEAPIGAGLYIAHTGIIIGSSKIGKNCKLHGQNCCSFTQIC